MLTRSVTGIRLQKDWAPTRIGSAICPVRPRVGAGMDAVQFALLPGPRVTLLEPVPVPVLDSLEKLVDFLNR